MKEIQIICVLCIFSATLSAQNLFEVKKRRVFSLTEIGVYNIVGKADVIGYQKIEPSDYRKRAKFQIRTMVGYFITEKLSAGIGIGAAKDFPLSPIFGELRYSLYNKANSPFAAICYGKVVGRHFDGSIFEIGIGYRKKLGQKNFITFRTSLNTTMDRDRAIIYYYDVNTNTSTISSADVRSNNLSFTVGFMF